MAHDLAFNADGSAKFAFAGKPGWHGLGTRAPDDLTPSAPDYLDQWLKMAGLDWEAYKAPAYIMLNGKPQIVDGQYFVTRKTDDKVLSPSVSSQYQIHQVREQAETFMDYIGVLGDLLTFDTMGELEGGTRIFFTAKYNGEYTVAGAKHQAWLLANSRFDGGGASRAQAVDERVVCQNTLALALGRAMAIVRSTHRSAYDKDRVAKELIALLQQTKAYKHIGDAMATVQFAREEVSAFFKAVLDIPFDAKREDISTRKLNQFSALNDAYQATVNEGTERNKVWTALNAVTRYVDHDRSTRGGDNESSARFTSAQFGSGAALKDKAWNLLLPLVKDKVSVAA